MRLYFVASVLVALLLGACGSEAPKLGEGEFCTDSGECAAGLLCLANVCATGAGESVACFTSVQCKENQLCSGGFCRTADQCTSQEQCPAHLQCRNGYCLTKVASDIVEDKGIQPGDVVEDEKGSDVGGDMDLTGQDIQPDLEPDLPVEIPCSTPADCDDANKCTTDKCENGFCANTLNPIAGCCQVKEDCTEGGACKTPKCSQFNCFYIDKPDCCESDAECNDNNNGTKDTCINNKCIYEQLKTCMTHPDCDDDNPCSIDTCVQNLCTYSPSQDPLCCKFDTDCNDNDPSTEDICLDFSCFFKPEGTCLYAVECDDLNSCTSDICQAGECYNVPYLNTDCNCTKDADCMGDKGGACIPYELTTTTAVLVCHNKVGSKMAGQSCALDEDCVSGICNQTSSGKLCYGPCTSNSHCYPGTTCGKYLFQLSGGNSQELSGCIPAAKECDGDNDCPAGSACVAVEGDVMNTLKTVCAPVTGSKAAGATCSVDSDCKSGICYTMWEKNQKICWGACKQASDCPAGLQCYPNAFYFVFDQATPTTVDDWYYASPVCQPTKGSFVQCSGDGDCITGEYCEPYTNVNRTALDPRCITKVGNTKGGGVCAGDVQCKSNYCVDSSTDFCFGLCKSSADCQLPSTNKCVAMNNYIVNDKGDSDPTNDIVTTVSICFPN